VVVISEMGVGKRSAVNEYPTQGRYGAGVVTASLSTKTGKLAAGVVASASDRLLMVSSRGNSKAVYVRSLPKARRATQGKELIAIRGRDRLINILVLSPVEGDAVKPTRRGGTAGASGQHNGSKTSRSRSRNTKSTSSRPAGGKKRSTR